MTKNKSIAYSLQQADCCGCKLCADVCPKGSISFVLDHEGFYVPSVNETTCIDCGICTKKCPELNVSLQPEVSSAISAYSKSAELHKKGSSGGVFANLAIGILKEGGKVFGAAFDENLQLRHIGIENEEEFYPLCKSKYLQSNCEGIYKEVLETLKDGRKVLFCGTPCQCQALSNAVNNSLRDNLLIVDFVCHGVSCQELFNDNIRQYQKKYSKVISYAFRNKDKAKYHHSFKISVVNKRNQTRDHIGTYYEDPYYYGYEKRFILRNSCYSCKWASTNRCSDITLSDFFGIKELEPKLKEEYISCLFCNTEKGQKAFESIKGSLDGIKTFRVADAAKNNECLNHPMKRPPLRDKFFEAWKNKGYEYVIKTYLTPKHKFIYDVFYGTPVGLRNGIRKIIKRILGRK